jgi:SAM-dependent methyltransferase
VDVEAIKERNRWMWGLGDYAELSQALRPAAEALADACAVSAGQEVLDVAAGDGNFALACAHEGARVVASDLAPGMVERGRARSEQEGYDIEWVEADVEALPFEDGRFDCVGSVFGAMIAPRPRVVAEELFRVVRPGGTVGMTAWTPQGFSADLFRLGRSYAPPSDQPLSDEWSVEDNVRERFDGLAARFDIVVRKLTWHADSPEELVSMLGTSAPPWVAAKQNLPPERWESLVSEALELARRWAGGDHRSPAGTARGLAHGARPVELENEYALIVARKAG